MIALVAVRFPFSESGHVPKGELSLVEAESVLRRVPRPTLGYYKTDFVLRFADGTLYEGRYDIGADSPTLMGHVRDFCGIYSGRWRPDWMDAEQRADLLAGLPAESRTFYARMLDAYDLRDAVNPPAPTPSDTPDRHGAGNQ